ncbi:hypothetical protein J2T56_000223 [Natronobacillus azotifigens]|uniref:Uncharacterized protein n=1 Tax=Natronobacillus azotifigens TaxID=472978 RepID=A0A9J6R9L7_9BACI|nr:hypothetical protein [Natronobacillus azotifigens]MCZ0701995.1 hypothetical protein [Natronobacillus azotifigens]
MKIDKRNRIFRLAISVLIGVIIAIALPLDLYIKILLIITTVIIFNKSLDKFVGET